MQAIHLREVPLVKSPFSNPLAYLPSLAHNCVLSKINRPAKQLDMPRAQRSRACQQCRERRVKVWSCVSVHIVRLLQIC